MAEGSQSTTMGGWLRILLGLTYVVVTGIVFLLGAWVGRDLGSRHPPEIGRSVEVTAPARPEPGDVPRAVDRTFFDEFREGVYNSLEEGEESTQEVAVTATPTAPGATSEAAQPTAGRTRTVASAPTATKQATVAPRATATRVPEPVATATARPAREAGRGSWVVQVGSTRNGAEAFDWALKLRGKGFSPHTDESPRGGTTWYRVRLGPYGTREEAVKMYQRLTGTTEFDEAYITTQ